MYSLRKINRTCCSHSTSTDPFAFLKGDTSEDMCKPLFMVYKDCVRVSISVSSNSQRSKSYTN